LQIAPRLGISLATDAHFGHHCCSVSMDFERHNWHPQGSNPRSMTSSYYSSAASSWFCPRYFLTLALGIQVQAQPTRA
jgi:hypothetical protein